MIPRNSLGVRVLSWLLILILLNTTFSCYYYTYRTDLNPSLEKLDKLKNSPNYIIVHRADEAFNLKSVRVDQQAQTISGTLQALSPDHKKYLETKPFPGSANRYRKKSGRPNENTPYVVNEVHFYLKDFSLKEGEEVTIPLSTIEKVDVYDPDTGATTASFIFGTIGIVSAAMLLLVIIILLTKSSCPFIYVHNGNEFVFAGEIYSGAIFRNLERDDYLMLPPLHDQDSIEVVIANKLKEKQFINQVGLLQVKHPVNSEILPDQTGRIHLIKDKISLTNAVVGGEDITSLLDKQDNLNFTFHNQDGEDFFNEVIVTFPKRETAKEGHLVLNAKNSLWGDFVYGEFTKLFGKRYMSWVEEQNNKPAAESKQWAVDQGLAMKVYVEVNNDWKLVDIVDLIGPLAFRDLVIPVDLTSHHSETVKIKLSAGFMLWDIDYVGMDYSEDQEINVRYLHPSAAFTQDGENVRTALLNKDDRYLEQLKSGDEAMISFATDMYRDANEQFSYVLHSRGYYQHVRDYSGSPEITSLLRFKIPGRFSHFSKEKYDEMSLLLQTAEISASVK